MDRQARKGICFMQKETNTATRINAEDVRDIKEKVLEIAAVLPAAAQKRLLESARALLKEVAE